MRPPSKFPARSPEFEKELAIVASRPVGFHRQMADRILAMDDVVARYAELLKKAKKAIDSGYEFIRSDNPTYDQDLEILNSIDRRVAELDPTMTATDISKILELVRSDIQSS